MSTAAANALLAKVWRDLRQTSMKREAEEAKANPAKFRNSRTMNGHTGYIYFTAGRDGRKRTIRFCYSVKRNVAGYFLVWRQVETKRTIKRDMFDSCQTKAQAAWWAKYQKAQWLSKHRTNKP